MKKLILILALLYARGGMAQIDKEFWFTPPHLSSASPQLYLFTTYDSCSFYLYYPLTDSSSYCLLYPNVPPSFSVGFSVPSSHPLFQNLPYNTPYKRAFHITPFPIGLQSPLSCHLDLPGGCYSLKGSNALGTEFTVPMQHFLPTDTLSATPCTIEIVATHDSTVLQITPSSPLRGGFSANATITVTLDSEQCYALCAAGHAANQNLAGTHIHASHPICVNVTNDCVITPTGCINHIGDQIVSNEHLGRRYVLLRNNSDYEHVTIVPTIPGDTLTMTINGVTTRYYDSVAIDIPLIDTATLISLDKPAALFQTTAVGCMPDGAQPPRIDCAGSPAVHFYSPTVFNYTDSSQFIAAIVVPTTYISNFLFRIGHHDTLRTDVITAADFRPLATDPRLSWCIKDLRPYYPSWGYSFDQFILENTAGNFQLAILRGNNNGSLFGYFSSYDTPDSLHFTMPSKYCTGDSIIFDYSAPHCIDHVLTDPNGLRLTNPPFILHNVDSSHSGLYRLQATDTLECLQSTLDSIYIQVSGGDIRLTMDSLYCTGDTIIFNYQASRVDNVALHGPAGLLLTQPPFILPVTDTTHSGTYWITARDTTLCACSRADSIHIQIFPLFQTTINDTIVENQLPWRRFDTVFTNETDTTLLIPSSIAPCDSIFNYHLHIFYNIEDTVLYYACESNLPVLYDDSLFYQEGQGLFYYTGSHGEDSLVTFILHVIPSSDTTICDSITEDQLPWFVFDTVFNDTVADYIFHTYNEAGCDSIIHYNLFIFWNGDHCDTALSYPNVVTPNGDGVNDRFVIGGLIEHNCFKYNELTIYDRTGHQVYHKRNISNDSDWWDPAAQRAPSGTYFYYFKAHGVNIWTQHRGVIEVLHDK